MAGQSAHHGSDAKARRRTSLHHHPIADEQADRRWQTSAAQLANYNPEGLRWHEIADDGYLYDHLVDHLIDAGWDSILADLFRDDRWMQARFVQCGYDYAGFQKDLKLAWTRIAHSEAREDSSALTQCVRYALIQGALNSVLANRVPELIARAVETGLAGWPAKRLMALETPTVCAMYRFYPIADDFQPGAGACAREVAFKQALNAATAPGLSGDVQRRALSRALDAASNISDLEWRARALAALIPHLSPELSEHALDIVLKIPDTYYRNCTLCILAPHLSGAALDRALAAGPVISSLTPVELTTARVWQLVAVPCYYAASPFLRAASSVLNWLRILVLAVRRSDFRAAALDCILTRHVDERVVANGVDNWDREMLAALTPHLFAESLSLILDTTQAVPYGGIRAGILTVLAPYVKGTLLASASDLALHIECEDDRAVGLAAIARCISGESRKAALKAALLIVDARLRAETLIAFLPRTSGKASLLMRCIREAITEFLLNAQNCSYDDIATLCFDDAIFQLKVFRLTDLLKIHEYVKEISQEWHWQLL